MLSIMKNLIRKTKENSSYQRENKQLSNGHKLMLIFLKQWVNSVAWETHCYQTKDEIVPWWLWQERYEISIKN